MSRRRVWFSRHWIDRGEGIGHLVAPGFIHDGVEIGAVDLRLCRWCQMYLAPDLWEEPCPRSPAGYLRRWWARLVIRLLLLR
ncbi:MAG: hypothetical protein ACREKK_02705 [Candidatus Methylomirabilales bacterium]